MSTTAFIFRRQGLRSLRPFGHEQSGIVKECYKKILEPVGQKQSMLLSKEGC